MLLDLLAIPHTSAVQGTVQICQSQLISVQIKERQVKLQCLSCPSNPTYLEFPGTCKDFLGKHLYRHGKSKFKSKIPFYPLRMMFILDSEPPY